MIVRQAVCLDDERLVSALLDEHGGWDSIDAAHLRGCPACTLRGESWSATLELMVHDARSVVPPPPVDLATSIRRAVRLTEQDGIAPSPAVRPERPSWWERVAEWASAPAVWRPALLSGVALCLIAGVWILRPTGPLMRGPAVSTRPSAEQVMPSPRATRAVPGDIARDSAVRRVERNAAVRLEVASVGSYAETMTADWAAWDDSTVTEVGALAHSSLRNAVVSQVSSTGGSDALSPDDAWRDLSDLTPEQKAWLAAELAKKMGG